MSRSDECAERVLAIVRPRYLVKLAVAGAVFIYHPMYLCITLCIYISHCWIYISHYVFIISLPITCDVESRDPKENFKKQGRATYLM